jgi:hypothetical protein
VNFTIMKKMEKNSFHGSTAKKSFQDHETIVHSF